MADCAITILYIVTISGIAVISQFRGNMRRTSGWPIYDREIKVVIWLVQGSRHSNHYSHARTKQ